MTRSGAGGRARVTLYTTRHCGYCRQAKRFLEQHAVPHLALDIEHNRRAARAFALAGGRSVPLIVVGEASLAGFDHKQLARLLCEAGYELCQ